MSRPSVSFAFTSTPTDADELLSPMMSTSGSDSDSYAWSPNSSTSTTISGNQEGTGSGTGSGSGAGAGAADEILAKRQRIRSQIAKEVMTTEVSYVQALDLVSSLYIQPLTVLSRSNTILSSHQLSCLFSNLQLITHLSQKFATTLTLRLSHWNDASCIADTFLEIIPFLRLYIHYVRNHDRAIQMLRELEGENKEFVSFLAKVNEDPRNRGMSLASYLIMPIQRIPRYKLLLEELIRYTDVGHPDLTGLHLALAEISATAILINASVKRQESRAFLQLPGLPLKERSMSFSQPTQKKSGRHCCSRGGFFSWG